MLKIDPEILRQLMLLFKTELNERIQMITEDLLLLEKGVSGEAREKCLDSIFREAHNIKGTARGVDAKNIAEIAHCLETLFSKFKREELTPSTQIIDICLLSLDRMQSAVSALESDKPLDFDLQALLIQLNDWQETNNTSSVAPDGQDKALSLEKSDHAQLKEESADDTSVELVNKAQEEIQVPVIASEKLQGNDAIVRIPLHKLDEVSVLVENLSVSKIEMEAQLSEIKQLYDKAQSFSRTWSHDYTTLKHTDTSFQLAQEKASFATITTAINQFRVSTQKLYKQMRDSSNRCGQIFYQLQDQVRLMHLMPAATQLQPLARSVRDIANELGKKIDFEIIGDDIEVDRPILEGIKDPLIHLLRNAIDHGIEKPKERLDSGKPETGKVTITVSKTGERIAITVSDDGAGISVQGISQKIIRKKLMTQVELAALSESEIIELIFRPGFSSKDIITDISGRGIGLDVVLSNIRNLKGNVEIKTYPGKGTDFILSLPVTLSADQGLILRAGKVTYIIPISSIERVMEISPDDVIDIGGNQAIVMDNEAIPIHDLVAILALGQNESKHLIKLPIVVISKGRQRIALFVDEIISEREIVIKRLKAPLKSIPNVMGAAFMGGNEIVIVLNPNDLVTSAMNIGRTTYLCKGEQSEAMSRSSHILVADDSITTRTFQKTILEAAGFQVSAAVNGQEAWDLLQKEDFDLIVTDVEMPLLDGFELTEKIKQNSALNKIPVIIVTSLSSEEEQRRGIEVGADAYILKSQFESKQLLDVVSQLI